MNQSSGIISSSVDFEGNIDDPRVMNALRGIEEEAKSIKLLGNY